MAWLLTYWAEPPWGRYQAAARTSGHSAEGAFRRLADPGMTASAMAYLRDVAAMSEARKKLAKGKGKEKRDKSED